MIPIDLTFFSVQPYAQALAQMHQVVQGIQQGQAAEQVWFLQHDPVYTLGTSAQVKDVLRQDIPAISTGRGGQVTYHGPGQRVAY